jgi:hypothetical protein
VKKLTLVLLALASVSAHASPDCFNDVRGYKSPTEAGQICHDVSDDCFNAAREYYGPVQSAQACKDVSTPCFNEMYAADGIGPMKAAGTCRSVDSDCYNYQHDKFPYIQDIAASCATKIAAQPAPIKAIEPMPDPSLNGGVRKARKHRSMKQQSLE